LGIAMPLCFILRRGLGSTRTMGALCALRTRCFACVHSVL
jgi:hypothetical protein